ncbi:MAG: DUF262 domain-containing protein [Planctomycetota bacterium]
MAKKRTATRIDESQKRAVEKEIKAKQSEVKYDLRDFTVDYLVQQFNDDRFYVPPYQRQFIWPNKHRCRFIESVMLGLPIPMMFVADMADGRLEIVDGAQRIQTLECFKSNDLRLSGLSRLPLLNDFHYEDLPVSQQRKFDNKALRIVVLEDTTTPETRQEIFDRVNTSGVKARPSEIRRGANQGKFMKFITRCAKDALFEKLCPMSDASRKRYENEELVLRFFAYSDSYKQFRHDVDNFLTAYVKLQTRKFDEARMKKEFSEMLEFVQKHFPYGFTKNERAKTTPRVRFEAISVGVILALREEPDLVPDNPRSWLESEEFEKETTTHASNSLQRLKSRIEFVRDHLLGLEG